MYKIISTLLLLLITLLARANVQYSDGNFFFTVTDLVVYHEGHQLELERRYVSNSDFAGIFGKGWGSIADNRLKLLPNGYIVVHVNGNQRKVFYEPQIEKSETKSPDEHTYWRSIACNEYIKKNNEGFVLYNRTSRHIFDKSGKLTHIIRNGRKYELIYGVFRGNLSAIKIPDGSRLNLKTNRDGQVTEMVHQTRRFFGKTLQKTSYTYEDGNLTSALNAKEETEKYQYTPRNNLSAIYFPDGTTKYIEYEQENYFVSKVSGAEGNVHYYQFAIGENEDHLTVHHRTEYKSGGWSDVYKELFFAYDDNGERYRTKKITRGDGDNHEVHYGKDCRKPVIKIRDQVETIISYNERCLPLKKAESTGNIIRFTYHADFDKVINVRSDERTIDYSYDDNGDLTKARSSDGRWVNFVYDDNRKIEKILLENIEMTFSYNDQGKPIYISHMQDDDFHYMHISYDNFGEIKEVESSDGSSAAMLVTRAFSSLFSILKFSDTDIGFGL